MKKVSVLLALMCVVSSAFAQKFFEIDAVNQTAATRFEVRAGAQSLAVTKDLYDAIKKDQNAYVLVTYVGENASAITVARKDKIQYMVCSVDSVTMGQEGSSMVHLSNGKTYQSPNKEWLKVRPGQKVAGCIVDGETKKITHRWHTVPRETEVTEQFPISPAPTAPVVQIDEENKVVEIPTVTVLNQGTGVDETKKTTVTTTNATATQQPAGRPQVRIVRSSK